MFWIDSGLIWAAFWEVFGELLGHLVDTLGELWQTLGHLGGILGELWLRWDSFGKLLVIWASILAYFLQFGRDKLFQWS